jgi:hypothetical protein
MTSQSISPSQHLLPNMRGETPTVDSNTVDIRAGYISALQRGDAGTPSLPISSPAPVAGPRTAPATGTAPQSPDRTRTSRVVRLDPAAVVRTLQCRRGPYPLRVAGYLSALVALAAAVWAPQLLAGPRPSWTGLIVGAVVAVYFAGLAINTATLYSLSRGTPTDVPAGELVPDAGRRLLAMIAIPGAVAIRHRRPRGHSHRGHDAPGDL